MKKTVVGVVSHKDFDDQYLPEGYQVIHVGSSDIPENKHWLADNTGDNIANKNPFYCELTAQYWMWKNIAEKFDYIGMVHYRRYFMNYHHNSKIFWDDVLSERDINGIMEEYDIIAPYLKSKGVGGSILYYDKSNQSKEWLIIDNIIKTQFPNEYPSFKKVISGKTQMWSNMFIAKQRIFIEYSAWLFEVLSEYDKVMKDDEIDKRTPRVDGYLSELLLLVWLEAHINKKKIYHCHVEGSEGSTYSNNRHNPIYNLILTNKNILDCVMGIKTKIVVAKRTLIDGL